MTYRQCELESGSGVRQVSWIPSEFAMRDQVLSLKESGIWGDGWRIVAAYSQEITEDQLKRLDVVR